MVLSSSYKGEIETVFDGIYKGLAWVDYETVKLPIISIPPLELLLYYHNIF